MLQINLYDVFQLSFYDNATGFVKLSKNSIHDVLNCLKSKD